MTDSFKHIAAVLSTRLLNFIPGILISIATARGLGPEGKGIYAVVMLFAILLTNFIAFGLSPATVYFVAQGRHQHPLILGNNILLCLGLGMIGMLIGSALITLLDQSWFINIPQKSLLLSLVYIPISLLSENLQNILRGKKEFRSFNIIISLHNISLLAFTLFSLCVLKSEVDGLIIAGIINLLVMIAVRYYVLRKSVGGIVFSLNRQYIKELLAYGCKVHIGSIISFMNYRLDLWLVNFFMTTKSVGHYSLGINIVERLILIARSSTIVLVPTVAGETDSQRKKQLTPVIARTVFGASGIAAFVIFACSPWLVEVLYSAAYLPAVEPLQILLLGIVMLSVSMVLAGDIAARGRPLMNTYIGILTLVVNLSLNLLWIPTYGLRGAAWATTCATTVSLIPRIMAYAWLSGNSYACILLPGKEDWRLYQQVWSGIIRRVKSFSIATQA